MRSNNVTLLLQVSQLFKSSLDNFPPKTWCYESYVTRSEIVNFSSYNCAHSWYAVEPWLTLTTLSPPCCQLSTLWWQPLLIECPCLWCRCLFPSVYQIRIPDMPDLHNQLSKLQSQLCFMIINTYHLETQLIYRGVRYIANSALFQQFLEAYGLCIVTEYIM